MKKYTNQTFEMLSKERKAEIMFFVNKSATKRTIQDEKGEKFFVYEVSNEEIALSEEWLIDMRRGLYTLLDKKKNDNEPDFLAMFILTIKNHYIEGPVKLLLKKLSKEELKQIYIECIGDLKKQDLDLYEYISRQELFDLLSQTKPKTQAEGAIIASCLIDLILELGIEVQDAGGIEHWIENKKEKDRKEPRIYAKNQLLSKIWKEDVEEKEKRSAASLLIKLQYNSGDLAKDMTEGAIDLDKLIIMYEIPSLKRLVREAMGKINLSLAMLVFATIEDRYILSKMNWNDIKIEELKVQGEKGMISSVVAKFIVEMYKQGGRTLTQEEIDDIFAEEPDRKERMRAYFILTQNGLSSEDKMIELYGEKINEDNQENPYEQSSELDVTVEELLGFFNTDKVIEKMKGYCNPELEEEEKQKADNEKSSFLNFYWKLLEASKIKDEGNVEQIQEEIATKLKERIQKGDEISVLIAIELSEKGVITKENMKEIFCEENQEKLIEMYQNKKIDDATLLTLYKKGFVEKYIVDLIYQDIDLEQLKERIQQMSPEDALLLYCLEIIGQLDNKDLHDINWEKVAEIIPREKLRSKISVLYKNENIGFDDVNKLRELKVISASEANDILAQVDLKRIFAKGLTSEDGTGGVTGTGKNQQTGVQRSKGTQIEIRDEYLSELGFKAVVNVYGAPMVIASGSFKGYRVYVESEEKYGVIIFESEIDGSSYIMHKAKVKDFIEEREEVATLKGGRRDWREKARTDGSVKSRAHTLNWGKNIIETIVEISSEFKIDDDDERRKYVREETKRLCEEHKDSIECLRMLKEEAKRE